MSIARDEHDTLQPTALAAPVGSPEVSGVVDTFLPPASGQSGVARDGFGHSGGLSSVVQIPSGGADRPVCNGADDARSIRQKINFWPNKTDVHAIGLVVDESIAYGRGQSGNHRISAVPAVARASPTATEAAVSEAIKLLAKGLHRALSRPAAALLHASADPPPPSSTGTPPSQVNP